jgi:hypothetical protein
MECRNKEKSEPQNTETSDPKNLKIGRYLEVYKKIRAAALRTEEEEEEERLQSEARRVQMIEEAKKKSKDARLARGLELRKELSRYDEDQTPRLGEGIKDFFDRTQDAWAEMAHEWLQSYGKQMRRDGFDLCKQRYNEVLPMLQEFDELLKIEKDEMEKEKAAGGRHAAVAEPGAARPRDHK